jgi:glucosamine-phosphate N-acetyltransferase
MENVVFCNLLNLLNDNFDKIEIIRDSYLLLLSYLTITSYLDSSHFLLNLTKINQQGEVIVAYTGSLADDTFEIIASGTIFIEPKIIREGKNVGHIEDIVVSKKWRGQGISHQILDRLKDIARENKCYKVILDCSEEVKNVYIKNGFQVKGIQMAEYF